MNNQKSNINVSVKKNNTNASVQKVNNVNASVQQTNSGLANKTNSINTGNKAPIRLQSTTQVVTPKTSDMTTLLTIGGIVALVIVIVIIVVIVFMNSSTSTSTSTTTHTTTTTSTTTATTTATNTNTNTNTATTTNTNTNTNTTTSTHTSTNTTTSTASFNGPGSATYAFSNFALATNTTSYFLNTLFGQSLSPPISTVQPWSTWIVTQISTSNAPAIYTIQNQDSLLYLASDPTSHAATLVSTATAQASWVFETFVESGITCYSIQNVSNSGSGVASYLQNASTTTAPTFDALQENPSFWIATTVTTALSFSGPGSGAYTINNLTLATIAVPSFLNTQNGQSLSAPIATEEPWGTWILTKISSSGSGTSTNTVVTSIYTIQNQYDSMYLASDPTSHTITLLPTTTAQAVNCTSWVFETFVENGTTCYTLQNVYNSGASVASYLQNTSTTSLPAFDINQDNSTFWSLAPVTTTVSLAGPPPLTSTDTTVTVIQEYTFNNVFLAALSGLPAYFNSGGNGTTVAPPFNGTPAWWCTWVLTQISTSGNAVYTIQNLYSHNYLIADPTNSFALGVSPTLVTGTTASPTLGNCSYWTFESFTVGAGIQYTIQNVYNAANNKASYVEQPSSTGTSTSTSQLLLFNPDFTFTPSTSGTWTIVPSAAH